MSGDAGTLTRLARLLVELGVDRRALDQRHEEAMDLLGRRRREGSLPRSEIVVVAVNLHAYYTALETLLERVARLLDEEVPAGAAWHQQLIHQMRVAVPSLRPAVVPEGVFDDLEQIRRFRHFFRNAYTLDLDPGKIRGHAERLERVHTPVVAGIDALRAHVEGLVDRLAAS